MSTAVPTPRTEAPLRVIGLMSGTSHDAIDAAAAEISTDGDGVVTLRSLGMVSQPYDDDLHALIVRALPPGVLTMEDVCVLDTGIGQAFGRVAARADHELCGGRADLVASHGQTLFHWVNDGRVRGTLQLGQAAWIAEATGATVVSDFRTRDVAAGGQGAPLVSVFDELWLAGRSAAAVNLGGISNATLVRPGQDTIAFDIGPANALIDAAVVEATDGRQAYDRDGAIAASGAVDEELLEALLAEPYYARRPPKTTGKELFSPAYLAPYRERFPRVTDADLVATLTVLTARTVARAVEGVDDVVVSGGGTLNPVLMGHLRREVKGAQVRTTDELGLPSAQKEALAFALLGYLTVRGLPGTVSSCTGARAARVLGSVTPGERPLMTGRGAQAPVALRIETA